MLISSKSRKALNFDISSNMLKKYYPSSNYRSGWNDIKLFLEKNNFIHRQYSGYVSKECIKMSEVLNIIVDLSMQLSWLKKCVKEFDATIVGDEFSLIDNIIAGDKYI